MGFLGPASIIVCIAAQYTENETAFFREEFRAPPGVRKVSEERTRRPQTLVYGYFRFRLSLAKSRPGVGHDAIYPTAARCGRGRTSDW